MIGEKLTKLNVDKATHNGKGQSIVWDSELERIIS